jgi:hypothetical protein
MSAHNCAPCASSSAAAATQRSGGAEAFTAYECFLTTHRTGKGAAARDAAGPSATVSRARSRPSGPRTVAAGKRRRPAVASPTGNVGETDNLSSWLRMANRKKSKTRPRKPSFEASTADGNEGRGSSPGERQRHRPPPLSLRPAVTLTSPNCLAREVRVNCPWPWSSWACGQEHMPDGCRSD